MQDYTLGERWGPLGGIIAMVVGTLLAFIMAIGLAYLLKKHNMQHLYFPNFALYEETPSRLFPIRAKIFGWRYDCLKPDRISFSFIY